METCYKVFRREVLQRVELFEKRFGFEPEIVANISRLRLRVYEIGVSYAGRTYEEGKKIGVRDGFRALYCILHYNVPHAPTWIQFLAYTLVGGIAAVANLLLFLMLATVLPLTAAALTAFVLAAGINYWLCVLFLFRHGARWSTPWELLTYAAVVAVVGTIDALATVQLMNAGMSAATAKVTASAVGLVLNFLGRRFIVFPDRRPGPWAPSN
jgi:putative flippase GtrA